MNTEQCQSHTCPNEDERVSSLTALFNTFKQQHTESRSIDDLSNTISVIQQIIQVSSMEESQLAFWLGEAGHALSERSFQTDSKEDLDDAISRFEEASKLLTCHSNPDNACILQDLGNALWTRSRYEANKTIEYLNRAVSAMYESVNTTTNERDSGYRLQDLGNILHARFCVTRSAEDLDGAINAYHKAIPCVGNVDRARVLNDLATALETKFDVTKCLGHLRELADVKRESVYWLANGYYDMGSYWDDYSTVLQMLFDWTGSLDDIDNAIDASKEAIELAYDNNDSALYLTNLASALQTKAICTWCIDDFDLAVKASADALNIAPLDHPSISTFFSNYGNALKARFTRLGRSADIDRAVKAHEMALVHPSVCSYDRAMFLNSLSTALVTRYSGEGPTTDLDKAIELSEQAISTSAIRPHDHLHTLATALLVRYDRIGDQNDRKRAMELTERVNKSNDGQDRTRARDLNLLGLVLLRKFERTMSINDVDEGITSLREALRLTEDYPESTEYRTNLGNALQMRFSVSGLIDDLSHVIELRKHVVNATPKDDSRAAGHMVNLANAVEARYWQTGSVADLSEAIEINQRVVDSIDLQHPNRAFFLHGLGRCLQNRYKRMGSLHDLNSAIVAIECAVQAVPTNSSRRAMYLGALGVALFHRSHHTRSIDDVSKAISACQESVHCTPDDFLGRPVRLTNLGLSLIRFHELTPSPSHLNQAVTRLRQAVDCEPRNGTRRHQSLRNLTAGLKERSILTGSMRDLQDRLRYAEEAAELLDKGHPDRAVILLDFIDALERMFGEVDTRDRRILMAEDAVEASSAPIHHRIEAALCAGNLHRASANVQRASHFFSLAVDLLPEMSPRILARSDQQRRIAMYSPIASLAAATVLDLSGDSVEALRLLEIGRGILASLQLDTRTDITDLESVHPRMSQEFKTLQDELDSELLLETDYTDIDTATKVSAQINRRHSSVSRMSTLLQEIRSLDGFERFLSGMSSTELLTLASHGPIVVFNVARTRCDALLITSKFINCLPLPDLHQCDIADYAGDLITMLDTVTLLTYVETNELLREILEWLWDVAVSPVLDALGLQTPHAEGEPWTHVWWIAGGWLNLLPLHAAGYHNDYMKDALGRVISSYIPTLKALSAARTKAVSARLKSTKALFVSMPHTPGMRDLPYVTDEIGEINSIIPKSVARSTLQMPVKAEVEEKMRDSQVIHFACHGISDPVEPSKSHLKLSDWQDNIFSVTDIIALKVTEPRLIYLSACHAAQARVEGLLDEGIHLAGACQLAGFSHVIGTLWEINDYNSVKVAKGVYSTIFKDDEGLELGKASEGLHNAVRKLRSDVTHIDTIQTEIKDDPLQWVPYIYLGA